MFRLFVFFISVLFLECFARSSNKARPYECVDAKFFCCCLWVDEFIYVPAVNTKNS